MEEEPNNMEVDDSKKLVMKGVVPTYTVKVHPLVIMIISDHFTRTWAQEGKANQVVGAIVGKKVSKTLEITNSYELLHTIVDEKPVIDKQYFEVKSQQFKEVYFDSEFLGWYTTGYDEPDEFDTQIYKQLLGIIETPILLKVSTNSSKCTELPFAVYEPADVGSDGTACFFTKVNFSVTTADSERISIDHIVRTSHNNAGEGSAAVDHLTSLYNAVRMLSERLVLLITYINDVESGQLPINPAVLNSVKTLVVNLNKIKPITFDKSYYAQGNDVAMITFLSSITKGTNAVNRFLNKMKIKHGFGDSRSAMARVGSPS